VSRKTTIAATTPARARKRPATRRPAAKASDPAAKDDRSHPKFAPIRTKRVFEEICEQVRREMAAGSLRPGDKLPPERELALKLGVSRAAVREALRSLEIAGVVGRSSAATRQLASRARRRVRERAPQPDADLAVQREVVGAFLLAARSGNLEALLDVLDPDVVFRSDGGGSGPLARPSVHGALAVARQAQVFGVRFADYAQRVTVNGGPGAIVRVPGQPVIVAAFAVAGGRIVAIDLVADPAKLGELGL